MTQQRCVVPSPGDSCWSRNLVCDSRVLEKCAAKDLSRRWKASMAHCLQMKFNAVLWITMIVSSCIRISFPRPAVPCLQGSVGSWISSLHKEQFNFLFSCMWHDLLIFPLCGWLSFCSSEKCRLPEASLVGKFNLDLCLYIGCITRNKKVKVSWNEAFLCAHNPSGLKTFL